MTVTRTTSTWSWPVRPSARGPTKQKRTRSWTKKRTSPKIRWGSILTRVLEIGTRDISGHFVTILPWPEFWTYQHLTNHLWLGQALFTPCSGKTHSKFKHIQDRGSSMIHSASPIVPRAKFILSGNIWKVQTDNTCKYNDHNMAVTVGRPCGSIAINSYLPNCRRPKMSHPVDLIKGANLTIRFSLKLIGTVNPVIHPFFEHVNPGFKIYIGSDIIFDYSKSGDMDDVSNPIYRLRYQCLGYEFIVLYIGKITFFQEWHTYSISKEVDDILSFPHLSNRVGANRQIVSTRFYFNIFPYKIIINLFFSFVLKPGKAVERKVTLYLTIWWSFNPSLK